MSTIHAHLQIGQNDNLPLVVQNGKMQVVDLAGPQTPDAALPHPGSGIWSPY